MTGKQIRRSKKEAAHERNALARLTRARHKEAARKRSTVIRDFDHLLKHDGLPELEDLSATIDRLIAQFRDGDLDPNSYDEAIFDPALDDLCTLPIGVLDHKELPLPASLIPRSQADLLALCERLIVRGRNPDLIAYVIAGWPGCRAMRAGIAEGLKEHIQQATDVLHRHVRDLWSLSAKAPHLYDAIVCGRHSTALRMLRTNGAPIGTRVDTIVALIVRQGLIWCANDLQMILARGALGARNPFGLLVSTDQVEMKPERIANDLKRHLMLLRLTLHLYATTAEENDPIAPKTPGVVPENDDLAQLLKRRLEQSAARSGVDYLGCRAKLDTLIEQIRREPTYGDEKVWRILEQPVTANELHAHFSGMWFSGLSHVQVAAVATLRYLQAEVWIERMVAERLPTYEAGPVRHDPAMPPFDIDDLGADWRTCAKDLLFLYRRDVLRDKQASGSGQSLVHRSKNRGWKVIEAALTFLERAGQRGIGDDHGALSSMARTFYLIDLIPEARLAR